MNLHSLSRSLVGCLLNLCCFVLSAHPSNLVASVHRPGRSQLLIRRRRRHPRS
jgi:hypothetical protein